MAKAVNDKLDTPEGKKVVTKTVENANLSPIESFIMAEVAADFLKGIRWVLIYRDSPQFDAKIQMLKAAVQAGNLQNKVAMNSMKEGYVVELDTQLIIDTMTSMQSKLPAIDVKQDFKYAAEAYKRTYEEFKKYIQTRIKTNKLKAEPIGLYCMNENPKITFRNKNELVSVSAFRLAIADLLNIKKELRTQGYDIAWGSFRLSPSKTGALTQLTITKLP